MVMVEPWVNWWSSIIYRYLHHEPFVVDATSWKLPQGESYLSTANQALPWMVFARDRKKFQTQFPQWKIQSIEPFMSFRYLLNGAGFFKRNGCACFVGDGWAALFFISLVGITLIIFLLYEHLFICGALR